jgi:hypothetical protein
VSQAVVIETSSDTTEMTTEAVRTSSCV